MLLAIVIFNNLKTTVYLQAIMQSAQRRFKNK